MSSPSPLHRLATQHCDEGYNRVSHFWVSQKKTFRSQGTDFWESNINFWVFFSESSIEFLQVTKTFSSCKVLYMYSFTTLPFEHLSAEIVIFMNVCHQMKYFSSDKFSFLWDQVLQIFYLLFWFHVNFKQLQTRVNLYFVCVWNIGL